MSKVTGYVGRSIRDQWCLKNDKLLSILHSPEKVSYQLKEKMTERDKKERLIQLLQDHLGQFFPPRCNYLLIQADQLMTLCEEKYEGDMEKFENKCITVMATLLGNLRANKLPITYEDKGQTFVIIHLTEPDIQMEAGQVVIWVGKTDPSLLSIKYARYVTEREGVYLPDSFYEATKMKIKKEDLNRCLTSSYFKELRQGFKDKGAERYSLAMRLFVTHNTTTQKMRSLDHDKILVSRRQRARGNLKLCERRTRSGSGVQETGDDPVASSTEQQVLHQALTPYREYRASKTGPKNEQDCRSSSPTGTEASCNNFNDFSHTDESSVDEHAGLYDELAGGKVGELRSEEPIATVKNIPRDGYVDEDKALGPNTDTKSQAVELSIAKPGRDDYV